MRYTVCLYILLLLATQLHAQYVYTIKADSVKITNCDSAELILENHTQGVPGFLFNTGSGRTIFKRAVQRINDSLYLIGADTLKVKSVNIFASNGLSADSGNIQLGQQPGQSGNPAALAGNREIPLNANTLKVTGQHGGNPFSISFQDENDDFIYSQSQSNSFTRLRIDNTDTGNSAGAGALFFNDAQHLGFFYMASQHNAYIPDGFALTCTGSGGLNFVTSPGPVVFSNYIYAPYSVGEYARFSNSGQLGLGIQSPSARLHIAAGSSSAGTSPIKLTGGTLLATPENGAIEYDGTDYYITQGTNRYKLSKTLTAQFSTSFGGATVNASGYVSDSLSVSGVAPGDVVTVNANSGSVNPPSIIIAAYVATAGTVTLRAYNAGGSAVTLGTDTYNIRVIK